MSLSNHIDELKKKHETLSKQIEHFQMMPSSDDLEVSAMKKQKLKLKEEITRLQA